MKFKNSLFTTFLVNSTVMSLICIVKVGLAVIDLFCGCPDFDMDIFLVETRILLSRKSFRAIHIHSFFLGLLFQQIFFDLLDG